jgi:hypothetical protein
MMPTPDPYFTGGRTEPESRPQSAPGVLTPLDRGQDPERDQAEHELAAGAARPVDERDTEQIIEDEIARTQRVYAPASERVPREPVPGHRDLVEHPDPATPERQSTPFATPSYTPPSSSYQAASDAWSSINSPTTRQPTPLAAIDRPTYAWDGEPARTNPTTEHRPFQMDRRMGVGIGVSWATVVAACVGVWLYMRWQHERNRPINRFRRQAMRAATEIRGRVPSAEEMMRAVQLRDEQVRPAVSFAAMLLSVAVIVLRRMRTSDTSEDRMMDARHRMSDASHRMRRDARHRMDRAVDRARDLGWQDRLMTLRDEALRLTAR